MNLSEKNLNVLASLKKELLSAPTAVPEPETKTKRERKERKPQFYRRSKPVSPVQRAFHRRDFWVPTY